MKEAENRQLCTWLAVKMSRYGSLININSTHIDWKYCGKKEGLLLASSFGLRYEI